MDQMAVHNACPWMSQAGELVLNDRYGSRLLELSHKYEGHCSLYGWVLRLPIFVKPLAVSSTIVAKHPPASAAGRLGVLIFFSRCLATPSAALKEDRQGCNTASQSLEVAHAPYNTKYFVNRCGVLSIRHPGSIAWLRLHASMA